MWTSNRDFYREQEHSERTVLIRMELPVGLWSKWTFNWGIFDQRRAIGSALVISVELPIGNFWSEGTFRSCGLLLMKSDQGSLISDQISGRREEEFDQKEGRRALPPGEYPRPLIRLDLGTGKSGLMTRTKVVPSTSSARKSSTNFLGSGELQSTPAGDGCFCWSFSSNFVYLSGKKWSRSKRMLIVDPEQQHQECLRVKNRCTWIVGNFFFVI